MTQMKHLQRQIQKYEVKIKESVIMLSCVDQRENLVKLCYDLAHICMNVHILCVGFMTAVKEMHFKILTS